MNMDPGSPFSQRFRKAVSVGILLIFSLTNILTPTAVHAQSLAGLPPAGAMVKASEPFQPAVLKGLKVNPANPLQFDFIVDKGDSKLEATALENEGKKLIKYFLTALTVPENELWVNLSPYEGNRIIPDKFGLTEMGRDLLAEDYLLKQLTASLMDPNADLGREFWQRVYERAQKEFGTTDIPVDTFNKVWILPDTARIYEKGNNVYLVESRMKVMLEQDYVALQNNKIAQVPSGDSDKYKVSKFASDIVREVIIPELTREVNEGKNFAKLRQVHNSLVLAAWYRKKVKESLLGTAFVGQNKIAGSESGDPAAKDKIYQQYLEAFKKGVYNYIKEDYDTYSQQMIPRKYFSGGYAGGQVDFAEVSEGGIAYAQEDTLAFSSRKNLVDFKASFDFAMNVSGHEQSVENLVPANTYLALPDGITRRITRAESVKTDEFSDPILEALRFVNQSKQQDQQEIITDTVVANRLTVIEEPAGKTDKLFTFGVFFDKEKGRLYAETSFVNHIKEKNDPVVTAAWFVWALSGSYEQAYRFLKRERPDLNIVFPNNASLDEVLQRNRDDLMAPLSQDGVESFKEGLKQDEAFKKYQIKDPGKDTILFMRELWVSAQEAIYGLALLQASGLITSEKGVVRLAPEEVLSEQQYRTESRVGMLAFASNPPTQAHYVVAMLWGMVNSKLSGMIARVTDGDYRKKFLFLSYKFRLQLAKDLEDLSGGMIRVMPPIKGVQGLNGEEVVPVILELNKGKALLLFYGNGDDHYYVFVLDKQGNPKWEIPIKDNINYAKRKFYPALLAAFLENIKIDSEREKVLRKLQSELEAAQNQPESVREAILLKYAKDEKFRLPQLDVQGKLALYDLEDDHHLGNNVTIRQGVKPDPLRDHERVQQLDTVVFPGLTRDVSSTDLRNSFYNMAVFNEMDLNAFAAISRSILRQILSPEFLEFYRMLVQQSTNPLLPISIKSLLPDDETAELDRRKAVEQAYEGYLSHFVPGNIRIESVRRGNQTEIRVMEITPGEGGGEELIMSLRFGVLSLVESEQIRIFDYTLNRKVIPEKEGFMDQIVGFIKEWNNLPQSEVVNYKDQMLKFLSYGESTTEEELKTNPADILTVIASDDIAYFVQVLDLFSKNLGKKLVILGGGEKYYESLRRKIEAENIHVPNIDSLNEAGLIKEVLIQLARRDPKLKKVVTRLRKGDDVIVDNRGEDLSSYFTRVKELMNTNPTLQALHHPDGRINILFARKEHERLRVIAAARAVFQDDPMVNLINFHSQSLDLIEESNGKLTMEMFYLFVGVAGGYLKVLGITGSEGFKAIRNENWRNVQEAFNSLIPLERKEDIADALKGYLEWAKAFRPGLAWDNLANGRNVSGEEIPKDAVNFVKSVLAAGKSAQASVDHAQTTQPLRGGIDFDISNVDLDIQTDGTGVPFNFGPDMLKNGNFDGLVPVILNVTPITDLPMFLSATEETKELAGAGV